MIPNIRAVLLAACAVFFWALVSTSSASDTPTPRLKPECMTIGQFLIGMEYSIGYHDKYPRAAFAYVPRLDAIIILTKDGMCLSEKAGWVLRRGMPGFRHLYAKIVSGRDA